MLLSRDIMMRNQSILFLNSNEVEKQAKSICRKGQSSGKLNIKYKFTLLPAQKNIHCKGQNIFLTLLI